MFKYLLAILILLFGAEISYASDMTYVWENAPNYAQSKQIFLEAFVKCYSQIPLDVLRKPSRNEMVQWLDETFDEIYVDYQNSKSHLWLSAKANDKVIGFLIIDIVNYPEEIYLAQLAIDPACQRLGIATSMINGLFEQFPKCARFVVITRSANEEAKGLYQALGFTPSSYMHEGYSRELFAGFEYNNLRS